MDSVLSAIRHTLTRASRHGRAGQAPHLRSGSSSGAEQNGGPAALTVEEPQPGSEIGGVVSAPGAGRAAPSQAAAALREAALSNIRQGHFGRAQRELEDALRLASDLGVEEDLPVLRAIRRCRRVIQSQPSNAAAHLELGRCYLELDLADEALAELREAARLAPKMAEPHTIMAIEHLYSSRTAEAEEEYELAMAIDSDLPPFSHLMDTLRREHLLAKDHP